MRYLTVAATGPTTDPDSVDEAGGLSVGCIAPVSLSDGLIRGGHGQYSNGWGRRVTQFSCLGFLGSILHSSFEGAGRAKCKAAAGTKLS
jgi:hypothetical protein